MILTAGVLAACLLAPMAMSPTADASGITYAVFGSANNKNLVVVFPGGYDYPGDNVSAVPLNDPILNFCRQLSARFEVMLLSNFSYPTAKPTLDQFFNTVFPRYQSVQLFGLSAGAVVVMAYAQTDGRFSSGIICAAPADYCPFGQFEQGAYWHLACTANETKIPLLFVVPALDDWFTGNFSGQMREYYAADPAEKSMICWNTTHSPFDWNPNLFAYVAINWLESFSS